MLQGRTFLALASAVIFSSIVQAKVTEFPAVPGEYIVKLKDSSIVASSNVLSTLGVGSVRAVNEVSRAYVVTRPVGELREHSLSTLNNNPYIEIAEPNYIYQLVGGSTEAPNDPKLGELWGLVNTGQKTTGDAGRIEGVAGFDINATRAWAIETGSSDIKVAVIDTGVDYTIADLAPNMWTNQVELNGQPGVDDDGNGCVDDIHGCDFANNDSDPKDDHGHGSHVSGTIGAKANNGTDIVGVAWNTTIIGIKFLSGDGRGTLENAIKSIDYATANKVHIMNNSWGGGGFSQNLMDSITRAKDAGILFVAAAGNSSANMDNNPQYPAGYNVENIVSVAAMDASGRLASFSNYGRSVHIAAPGVNILSTTPGRLQSWSGTSMACPHVAGVAALLYSQDATQSFATVKERLMAGARPTASIRGKVATGMLDAYYSLSNETPPADPNDPTSWPSVTAQGSTPHPYGDNASIEFIFEVPGAQKMAIHFSKFETEGGYDVLSFYDEAGTLLGKMSGDNNNGFSPVFNVSKVRAVFTSDSSVTKYGFDVDSISYQ